MTKNMVEEMTDRVLTMPCGSVIQHGHFSDRVYLMKIGKNADSTLPHELITIAEQNDYTKVFVKIPASYQRLFLNAGFIEEASIPEFYNGEEACIFMGHFLSDKRAIEADLEGLDKVRAISLDKADDNIKKCDLKYEVKLCIKESFEELNEMFSEMTKIYREVFSTYPFPIHDPDYLAKMASKNVMFFGVEFEGKFVALSSAEIDRESSNVEMTDFATLPQYRGNGFGIHLLDKMESVMKNEGIKTSYTIARAASVGMNTVFARKGYIFGGRLKNNTQISGSIESMNVWYKKIQ